MPSQRFTKNDVQYDAQKHLRSSVMRFLGQQRYRRPWGIHFPFWPVEPPATNTRWNKPVRSASSSYIRYATQLAIFEVIGHLYAQSWDAYLVGGTLRDLTAEVPRNSRAQFVPRDIDIAVLAPSVHALEAALPSGLIRRHTRFGGLHLAKTLATGCEVHFDIWPLSETWAFKEYDLDPSMQNFPLTPFLNLDAIAIQLFPESWSKAEIYQRGFFSAFSSRLLDINFEPNPYPDICAVRSLIVAARLQFGLSRKLASFILARSDIRGFSQRFQDAQASHYGHIRCDATEIDKWLSAINTQIRAKSEYIQLPVSRGRQLQLWQDHPPDADHKPLWTTDVQRDGNATEDEELASAS